MARPPIRESTPALWCVGAHQRHRVPPGQRYWFNNARRPPSDAVVVQLSLAGAVLLREPGQADRPVPAGCAFVYVYGEPTSYGQPEPLIEPYECQWVLLRGAGLQEQARAYLRAFGPIEPDPEGRIRRAMDELIHHVRPPRRISRPQQALAVTRFVMELFEQAEARRYQRQSPAERAVEHLLNSPTEPASLGALADRFGCSREHFSRLFRQRTGRSPQDYVAQARLNRALELLRGTSLPVNRVADVCGFGSSHTLTRRIKAATGVSPSALRRGQGGV
jgi:AraC-like DNA-binding protein